MREKKKLKKPRLFAEKHKKRKRKKK